MLLLYLRWYPSVILLILWMMLISKDVSMIRSIKYRNSTIPSITAICC